MSATDTTTEPARCRKCRRPLRNASPDGLGPKCRRNVRRANRENAARYQGWQVAKAAELLELGAIVPLRKTSLTRVFLVVSDDGSEIYRTAASGQCNCPAGLRGVRCYHGAAAAAAA
ncbi:hypothetical protein E0L36_22110 [Streptomyces sp. AJS327]|uniref:hypothetical protein n=1 Tax=Streptomyces sp. AJS327 TaxID=2545265 RepID=UPI0015DD642A|nr:hypothetical protein [Streptomyces sp. AJS327]MBA0053472.1 hypothetical protein [Streptomyces sp. AJS327]